MTSLPNSEMTTTFPHAFYGNCPHAVLKVLKRDTPENSTSKPLRRCSIWHAYSVCNGRSLAHRRYLKTGEQLALLPLEFDSSTHDVVVIPKRPALPD